MTRACGRHAFLLALRVSGLCALAVPASAQVDLTGMWAPIFHEDFQERIPGPEVGDYAGLPVNDALRLRADSWDAGLLTLPEHQCKPHPSTYGFRGVGNLRITADIDDPTQRTIKINTHIQWQEQRRQIWMDGREHPPEYAAHTWQGFSTGRWEGPVLVVRTTHLKAGWIRRNGLVLSDRTTMTERFIRHGNYITHVSIVEDPVYLTEAVVRSNGFQLTANPAMQPYPCYPTVEVPRDKGEVPHNLPGANPYLGEFAKKNNLPQQAMRGGIQTAMPEFMKTLNARAPEPETVAVPAAGSPEPGARQPPAGPAPATVRSMHVQGNVWMLIGPASNAAVQIGDDGVLVVDTMRESDGEAMIAEIRRLAGNKPIRWIVNTHAHADHTGGNLKVAEAGESIIAGNFVGQAGAESANFAQIIAHENVELAMGKVQPAVPVHAMPTDTFFVNEFEIYFNGEAVQLIHVANAHTDGDVMVFFRKSDVLVAGDLLVTTAFPIISQQPQGNYTGAIAALNRILDITVPAEKQEGGTYVIPGHGRLTDEADVVDIRDMATIIEYRMQDAVKKGMTLAQVKAARLVRDYEGRYGMTQGAWTTDMFVEAAYRAAGGAR
jgi:glyoxylase-like metal-dependent hydrolase (beta-lactamase superfamily II)